MNYIHNININTKYKRDSKRFYFFKKYINNILNTLKFVLIYNFIIIIYTYKKIIHFLFLILIQLISQLNISMD